MQPAHDRRERRARQVSTRSPAGTGSAGETRITILVAIGANGLIALTKLAGGLLSGSTALLAEAAHSTADTVNQGFLLASTALAARKPTEGQPFGHGQQRYLWTFLAAVGMFVAGAVFAIGYGIVELLRGEESPGGFAVAWVTLGVAFAAESTSWVRAMRQVRGEARDRGMSVRRLLRVSRDPNVKMVVFEDSAALAGIAIAASGIGLHQATGQPFWDAAASIGVGVLLIGTAIWMGRDTGRLLIGASARPEERAEIERVIEQHEDVVEVAQLLTMVLAPNALLAAARVDLRDDVDAGEVERAATEIDDAVRAAVADVTEVFIDATPAQRDPR